MNIVLAVSGYIVVDDNVHMGYVQTSRRYVCRNQNIPKIQIRYIVL